MNNRFLYFGALISGCALLLSACASEENAVSETAPTVQFVISAPFGASPSRAANEGEYVAAATPAELIKSYAVAVTPSDADNIVAFVSKDGLTGVESDIVDLQLRSGQYKVYGFANVPTSYLTTLGIKKGGTIPTNLGDLRTLVPGVPTTVGSPFLGSALVPASQLGTTAFPAIPMTSIAGQIVNVTERVNQTFGIEVRRMLAKLQFDFRNPTDKALELSSIGVSDMTLNQNTAGGTPHAPFLLMNPEEGRNPVSPVLEKVFDPDVQKAKLSYAYSSKPTLTAGYDATKTSGKFNSSPQHSEVFYVLESAAPTTGSAPDMFQLDFDIAPSGGTLLGDNMRYALTSSDALTLIHRNDWIVIPITIGEWVMDLTALSYPPIGGYPDAKVTSDGENVFYVKFSAPGPIAFYPTIHKYYSASDFFYLNDPNRIKPATTHITVTGDPIFSVAPTDLGSAGEYTATLSGATGKSTVTIETTFYPNYPDLSVEKVFKAVVYVEKV